MFSDPNASLSVIPIDCDESKPSGRDDGKTSGPINHGLGSVAGSTVSFRDLSYQIETRVRSAGCSCRKESQYILKNARFVAIGYFTVRCVRVIATGMRTLTNLVIFLR